MFSLSPKEDKFFELFRSTAKIACKASRKLVDYMGDEVFSEEKNMELKEIEHEGDKMQHEILKQLNKSFITPFDREDIYAISKGLDDIIDHIEYTSSRFIMLNVEKPTKEAREMGELIVQCCDEVKSVMEELKSMKSSKKLAEKIIEVNRLEEVGDKLSRKAIKELFRSDLPVLDIIKWREIYEALENTLDACEDVANAVEGVVMKNA
ncbi:MAG: DUF47 domain-containing protein [Clostridiaceae bacterium]